MRARFTAVMLLIVSIAAAASAAQGVKHRGSRSSGDKRENQTQETSRKRAGKRSEAVPYRAGEVRVTVQGNRNPVVPLGLALSGAVVVEFPAGETYYGVHS